MCHVVRDIRAGESTSDNWPPSQLNLRVRWETIRVGLENQRIDLQRPLSTLEGVVRGFGVIN